MKFKSINIDFYIFIRKNDIIVNLYVNDLIVLTLKNCLQKIIDIKNKLNPYFKIKKLNTIKRVLNIKIYYIRSQQKTYLNQQVYIKKFLYEFVIKNSTIKVYCCLNI